MGATRTIWAGPAAVALVLVLALPAAAQDPAPAEPAAAEPAPREELLSDEDEFIADVDDLIDGGCPKGTCCPPATGDKLIMAAASFANFLIMFFLMVRLLERVFIRREASPMLGRHLGISAALFLGGGGMVGIFYMVSGCWYGSYTYWALFAFAVWLIHFLYTMFAVRQ